jgi:hypothetical protein
MEQNPFLKGRGLKKTGLLETIVSKEENDKKTIEERQLILMEASVENQKKAETYKERVDNPPKIIGANVLDYL